MDIEAIREEIETFNGYCSAGQLIQPYVLKRTLDGYSLALDRICELETEKKRLEDLLCWRNVGEEKPPIGEELLVKRGERKNLYICMAKYYTGCFTTHCGKDTLMWKYRDGASYFIEPGDQWRPIEEGRGDV